MSKHDCLHEGDIATMKEQIETLFHRLNGNGEKGLLEKMEEVTEKIMAMENYARLKTWVMGSTIAFLTALCTFLATELYHAKLG